MIGTDTAINAEHDAEVALDQLWRSDGFTPLPVDPVAIATRMGVRVWTAWLERDVAGLVVDEKNGEAEIHLNIHDSEAIQRYTCAHEIGHLVEHRLAGQRAEIVDFRDPFSDRHVDRDETYANSYANSLLMPVREVGPLLKIVGPDGLHTQFGVPLDMVVQRLVTLGLVQPRSLP